MSKGYSRGAVADRPTRFEQETISGREWYLEIADKCNVRDRTGWRLARIIDCRNGEIVLLWERK